MNRIVLIAVWLGPLPEHFPVWVESAGHNRFIDFRLITDQMPVFPMPANVEIVPSSMASYSEMASRVLGEGFSIFNPYKLCDLKLMSGKIYPHIIAGYDWWGYCDLDIVWGDLTLDIHEEALQNSDKVGLNGHCSLWRVSEYDRTLSIIMTPDYVRKLRDVRFNYALDEHMGLGAFYSLKPKIHLFRHDLNIDAMSGRLVPQDLYSRHQDTFFWSAGQLIWREFTPDGYYDTHHSYIHLPRQRIGFEDGCSDEEYVYLITPGSILKVNPARSETVTNVFSDSFYKQNWRRRISYTLRNRLKGGSRSKAAL